MSLIYIQSHFSTPDGGFEVETPPLEKSWREKKRPHGQGTLATGLLTSSRDLPLLPYEIICRIFLEGRKLDAGAPTIISHVCRNWRQIALSQFGLWTNIELEGKKNKLDRALAWADRSKNLPINVKIRYSEQGESESIIAWLQDKANRVKCVTILHSSQNDDNGVLKSFPPLRYMESFQIVGTEEISLDIRWVARILRGSPHLSSMAWSGVGGLHSPQSLAGLASKITHLSIGANSYVDYAFPLWVDAILDVIANCTGLTSLECHALGKEDDREPRVVSLPCLSSLTIGDGPETCLILKYLDAPKLRTFRLVGGNALNENDEVVDMPDMEFIRDEYSELLVDCLRCLNRNCSPSLKKVVWDRTIIDMDVLHHCAPHLSRMEELYCRGISNIPLSLLAWGTEVTRRPFPCLRNMVFTKCTFVAEWLNLTHTLINKRGVRHFPIKQIIVQDCPDTNDIYFKQA